MAKGIDDNYHCGSIFHEKMLMENVCPSHSKQKTCTDRYSLCTAVMFGDTSAGSVAQKWVPLLLHSSSLSGNVALALYEVPTAIPKPSMFGPSNHIVEGRYWIVF